MKIEDSSWLDEAFDEKKAAAERERLQGKGTLAASIGCVVVVVAAFLLFAVAVIASIGILGS